MFSIAVTGGIASGNSLFGSLLSNLGADVADADEIVRALHRPGGRGALLVASAFGSNYLLQDGSTDRTSLGNLIFSDASARQRLAELLHPLVRDELLSWKDRPSASSVKVAQIPLLFEKGWESDWDLTIDVEALERVRMERLLSRGLSEAQAFSRINAQMTSAKRIGKADIVIHNDATVAELEKAATRLIHYLEKKQQ